MFGSLLKKPRSGCYTDADLMVTNRLIPGLQGARSKVLDRLYVGLLRHHLAKLHIMLAEPGGGSSANDPKDGGMMPGFLKIVAVNYSPPKGRFRPCVASSGGKRAYAANRGQSRNLAAIAGSERKVPK
jgi:hypothetical protein